MSNTAPSLPDDPAILKAMIAALEVENGQLQEDADRMAATLRAHEALVQALQIQIARLRKQKFGASSEKIEREIEQLELALESLEVAAASNAEPEEDGSIRPTMTTVLLSLNPFASKVVKPLFMNLSGKQTAMQM